MARAMIGNCITCFRLHTRAMNQLIAEYLSERVNPSPPLSYIGIELGRPMCYKEADELLKRCIVLSFCFLLKQYPWIFQKTWTLKNV